MRSLASKISLLFIKRALLYSFVGLKLFYIAIRKHSKLKIKIRCQTPIHPITKTIHLKRFFDFFKWQYVNTELFLHCHTLNQGGKAVVFSSQILNEKYNSGISYDSWNKDYFVMTLYELLVYPTEYLKRLNVAHNANNLLPEVENPAEYLITRIDFDYFFPKEHQTPQDTKEKITMIRNAVAHGEVKIEIIEGENYFIFEKHSFVW
jgi:hypothetical protein